MVNISGTIIAYVIIIGVHYGVGLRRVYVCRAV